MDHKIVNMLPFKVIGFQREFSYETAYSEIPKFWDEIFEKYAHELSENCIGEFGVCIDDLCGNSFRYLIAGRYTGGDVPEGMAVYEFPRCDWAVFDCIGPLPDALQSLNTRVFREWLPGNPDYEICGNANVEWYDPTDCAHSAIWVPVIKRSEAKKRWGGTAAFEEYEKRGDKSGAAAKGLMDVFREFGGIKELAPDSKEAAEMVKKLKAYITENFYTCTDDILSGLGKMYVGDERMKSNIDAAGGEGTAEFVSRAISAFTMK